MPGYWYIHLAEFSRVNVELSAMSALKHKWLYSNPCIKVWGSRIILLSLTRFFQLWKTQVLALPSRIIQPSATLPRAFG